MAVKRFEMLASAAWGASGNSEAFTLDAATMLMVGLDVTAVSGTTPTLDLWLQGSDDGGITWYDLPYDLRSTVAGTAGDVTADANKRNINGASSCNAANKYQAIYKHVPTDTVRLKWIIGGTTPSFTLSASGVAK